MPIEFKNGSQVKVGPFKTENIGKFEKTFRLFYFNEDSEMQYFGPKFGFAVQAQKNQGRRILVSEFRQKIEALKKTYKVVKGTEYVVERLRDIGITE